MPDFNDDEAPPPPPASAAAANDDPDPATAAAIQAALKEPDPPTTRSTRSTKRQASLLESSSDSQQQQQQQQDAKRAKTTTTATEEESKRPKAQELFEDYIEFAANVMLPSPNALHAPLYHALPTMSALRFLTSPQRRRMVWEDWSPREICLFEAAICHYGKDFYAMAKEFGGSKSTQQIVDFYYLWKKTLHYKKWKKTYVPAHLDVSDEETEEKPEGATNNGSGGKTGK